MVSLGIDIGGTGCKCVAFDDKGVQLALSYKEYPLASGATDLPPGVMMDSVFHVITGCVGQLEDPSSVRRHAPAPVTVHWAARVRWLPYSKGKRYCLSAVQ